MLHYAPHNPSGSHSRHPVWALHARVRGHTPLDPAATESWVLLSLRHFEHTCIMPPSQVLKGLTLARERGYIVRRPAGRAYEYALHWRDEAAHTPQDGDSASDPLLSGALYIDTSENDDMETDTH